MKGKEKDVDEQIQKMMEQPSGKMKKKRGIDRGTAKKIGM